MKAQNRTETRPDYMEKVSGEARYVTDMVLPDMAYARIIRSPHPHARILSIECGQAKALTGVLGVFSGQDLTPQLCATIHWGLYFNDRPVIATEIARYAGEPVAVVIAESEAIAEDAIELIDIDYEVLPFVTEGKAALEADAPLVHENFDV
ncbi:MAG: hypothetical protein ACTH1W_00095, partial [Advenella sp.]